MSIDAKIRELVRLYDTMLEQLRALDVSHGGDAAKEADLVVATAKIIEEFKTEVRRINVKG